MALEDKILRANLHVVEGRNPIGLNFAQFYVDGEPYLRIRTSRHPLIVESFVFECEIEGEPIVNPTDFERATWNNRGIPPLENGRYQAVGFGRLGDAGSPKKIKFRGESGTYFVGVNKEHIQKLAVYFPDWEFEINEDTLF